MTIIYIVIGIVGIAVLIGLFVIFDQSSDSQPLTSQSLIKEITDADIRYLANKGQKIQAVKEYKNLHGCGLKEAKDAVERMM